MTQVIGTSPLSQLSTPTVGLSVLRANHSGSGRNSASSTKLNLVSLMDIFTILVFFLMLNTGDVEVLQPDKSIDLPESTATLKPADAPVIKINDSELLFRNNRIVRLDTLKPGDSIASLEAALNRYKQSVAGQNKADGKENSASAISIMSDGDVNYALLKRVLYACAQAGFRDIGLATDYRQTDNSHATP